MQRLAYGSIIAAIVVCALFVVGSAQTRAEQTKTKKVTPASQSIIEGILKREKEFTLTDGNSYYTFRKDGIFESGPINAFGRTIEGRWKSDGYQDFVITGQWGWVNGISRINDRRQMKMTIFSPVKTTVFYPNGVYPHGDAQSTAKKFYTAYFVIDEIVRMPDVSKK